MNSKKGNALIIVLVLALLVVVGVGIYAYHKYGVSYEQASASCAGGQFCSGSVYPATVAPGGKYVMDCNYGYNGNGVYANPGSGNCTYKAFSGKTAVFDCTASTTPGTFANSCRLGGGSPYPAKVNIVNTLTVGSTQPPACAPGKFCSGSVSPASVAPGGAYTMDCNYGYSGNGIETVNGSGNCTYNKFLNGSDTVQFNCVAGTAAGTFTNSCKLDSGSPYATRTDAVNSVTVQGTAISTTTPTSTLIPSYAISSGDLDGNSLWKWQHDIGTSGGSVGTSQYPLSVGGYNDVREYEVANYSNYGGERYSVDFVQESTTTHFVYDVWVESPEPSAIGNLELDMNQVVANGNTVISAFQCDSGRNGGVWDYSKVTDEYSAPKGTEWIGTNIPCKISAWTPNAWHHIQISTQRDNEGNVTYNWVAVDGVVNDIGITNFEEQALGWGAGDVLVNFQLDPSHSAGDPMIAYVHDLTVYRW